MALYDPITPILQSQTNYWKTTQLIQRQVSIEKGRRQVIAILDQNCWRRLQNGIPITSIPFKYATDYFIYCNHVSYKVYQDNDAVFFYGLPTPNCPIHRWSRAL